MKYNSYNVSDLKTEEIHRLWFRIDFFWYCQTLTKKFTENQILKGSIFEKHIWGGIFSWNQFWAKIYILMFLVWLNSLR